MSKRSAAAFVACIIAAATPVSATASPAGTTLTAVVGTGSPGFSPDGALAAQAPLNAPSGAAVAPNGTLYVSDTGNHVVRAVAADGRIRTVAGSGKTTTRPPQISRATPATDVALATPTDLAVSADGTLYIADAAVKRIYALAPNGTLTVLVDARSTEKLNPPIGVPAGVAVGRDGTVYIADEQNNRVIAARPDGDARVTAGNGALTASRAGGPAAQVPIGAPNAVAVDSAGHLWIAGGLLLRRVEADTVATVTQPQPDLWALQGDGPWPPTPRPLIGVENVGAGDAPFVFDRQRRTVFELSPGGALTTVTTLDASNVANLGLVRLAAGQAGSRLVYLVDTGNHRVWSARAPVVGRSSAGDEVPLWPWLTGGAALLVVIPIVIVFFIRRRRAP